jgi:hypothetical protein
VIVRDVVRVATGDAHRILATYATGETMIPPRRRLERLGPDQLDPTLERRPALVRVFTSPVIALAGDPASG